MSGVGGNRVQGEAARGGTGPELGGYGSCAEDGVGQDNVDWGKAVRGGAGQ